MLGAPEMGPGVSAEPSSPRRPPPQQPRGHTYENVVVSKPGGAAYENHTFGQSRAAETATATPPLPMERKASAYDSEAEHFV